MSKRIIFSTRVWPLLVVQLAWAFGCVGYSENPRRANPEENQPENQPEKQPEKKDNGTPIAPSAEVANPPVIIVSIPSSDPGTARSTQFIKTVFEEQDYQVIAVTQQKGPALLEFLKMQNLPRTSYFVVINNHGSIELETINGQRMKRHVLEGGTDEGGAVTKEDIMDPISEALGIENLIYFIGACHSGQVINDYESMAQAPAIIPESRAEIPSYGFTEDFEGGDVQQLFLRMLPRGSKERAAADSNKDGLITLREFRDYINNMGLFAVYGGDPFSLSDPGLFKGPVFMARQIIPTLGPDETVFINNLNSNPSSLDRLSFVTPPEAISFYESAGFQVQIVEQPTYEEHLRLLEETMSLE